MKLTAFSVTNFRSIRRAHKVPISDTTTTLIGRNNEGKSNVLKALEIAMELLQRHANQARMGRMRSVYYGTRGPYSWERDFPISIQERTGNTQTILRLEFNLDETEILEFKQEVGSNLNGSLPLEIKIGKENRPDFSVIKKGPGAATLSRNSNKIASFIANRIFFNYIPAVRTDKQAMDVIGRMLSQELRSLERDAKYHEALSVIQELQVPKLEELAGRIQKLLKDFLPTVEGVQISTPEHDYRPGRGSNFRVLIDDGTPTELALKGDGVKSLAALGLLRGAEKKRGASIIAIEEPESHLHPGAIHQLNEIIASLSEENQVIVTTHNPLFVDRQDIKSNIIVDDGRARLAKDVSTIRDLLGVRASDNLTNANFALVVEGEEDVRSLGAILRKESSVLSKCLKERTLVIEPIGGAGNLSYKLSMLKTALCTVHCYLDGDEAGRAAFEKANQESLVSLASCTFVVCPNKHDSEFEDIVRTELYAEALLERFGVKLTGPRWRNQSKWSDRAKATFLDQGKLWDKRIATEAKALVANKVASKPKEALIPECRGSIDALIQALERMVSKVN